MLFKSSLFSKNIYIVDTLLIPRIRKQMTVRHSFIKYYLAIITTHPLITVKLKTTRTFGKTQLCEKVPGDYKM